MKLIKIKGTYSDLGKIKLENRKTMHWKDLTDEEPIKIPFGSSVELSIAFDEHDFLSGKNGIVWASYDERQVEIIKNALLTLNIETDIKENVLNGYKIVLLRIVDQNDLSEAIDFIWRSKTGLRLKPDWFYPEAQNISFEQWLSGH